MKAYNFFDFPKKLAAKTEKNAAYITYPHLSDVAVVQFRKGSTKMFWKNRHTDTAFPESEFMPKKYREGILKGMAYPLKVGPRGVNAEKKRDILEKIGPCMPESRLKFWRELEESESAKDLTLNYDKVDSRQKQKESGKKNRGKKHGKK